MSEDAKKEPRPVATSALAVRHSNHAANEGPVRIQYKCLVPYLCIPRIETVQPHYFQNRIIKFFSPNFHIYINHRYMNVGIGNEAAQFHSGNT